MSPAASMARPLGVSSTPAPGNCPHSRSYAPIEKRTALPAPVSATKSFDAVTAIPCGVVSWPGPPSLEISVPLPLYSRTVCADVDDTQMLPDGSSAIPAAPVEAHEGPATPAVEYSFTIEPWVAYTVPPLTASPVAPDRAHEISGAPPAVEKR